MHYSTAIVTKSMLLSLCCRSTSTCSHE